MLSNTRNRNHRTIMNPTLFLGATLIALGLVACENPADKTTKAAV